VNNLRQSGNFHWFTYQIKYAGLSDKGLMRHSNQDAFLIIQSEAFFAIADGAGGHENGARASQLTLEGVGKYLRKEIDISGDTTRPIDAGDDKDVVKNAISYANRLVYKISGNGNMASTIVSCQLHRNQLLLEHVGDSRCYLFRCGTLQQLTEDHSLVNDLFQKGKISRDEMTTHKHRNVITRAIGVTPDVQIDSKWIDFQDGDIFLLCSDGLSSYVSKEQITQSLENGGDLIKMAETLVAQANQKGGQDNITVVLFSFSHVN
jgi:serine/threonine protein phosphatase PrpC